MAKQNKNKQQIYCKDTQCIVANNKFVYLVDIFKYLPKSYNLEDSKHIESAAYKANSEELFKKDNVQFKRSTELCGAPVEWLIKNNFKLKV